MGLALEHAECTIRKISAQVLSGGGVGVEDMVAYFGEHAVVQML